MDVVEIDTFDEDSLDSEKIKHLLCSNSNKYIVIENKLSKPCPSWWKIFGFPGILDENKQYRRIFGYVSCFKCFQTFIYSSKSGTTRLKEHEIKCIKSNSSSSSPSSSSSSSSSSISISSEVINQSDVLLSTQSTLAQHGFKKSIKLSEKDIENMKKLSAQWMCENIRPFSVIEDSGFRAISQELIRIGHKYGVVDVDDVLRGRKTTAQTIYNLADSYRERIKQILIEPLQQRAVTISPDFWLDPYKNISYLGLNVSFVDANHRYFSIDLFCRAYFGVKSGDLIVKSLQTHLQEFGINDLTSVNILCDRGSNFVKGFRDYDPLFCYGHRLNNILKTSFFQNAKNKKKTPVQHQQLILPRHQIIVHEDDSEDDEDILISIPIIRNRKQKDDNQQLSAKASVDDIPGEAKAVLLTLSQCKKVIKFIKKSGLNKEIQRSGGVTVHQSIDIRWLSIMESLESILRSFKIIKKILINKQQQKLLLNVNDKIIKQLLLLLKPFQDVIKLIQVGNSPSLHMVLLCTQTLRDALKSYESLMNYNNVRDDHQLEQLDEAHDDILEQLEGVKFFLNRMRNLLSEMLVLDVRHYTATALHPKYRSLKSCTFIERSQCYHYIRQRLQLIDISPNELNQQQTKEPTTKRFKADPFRRFESDDLSSQQETSGESGNESEEYPFASKKIDELDRYLSLELDRSKLSSNPLDFWKEQHEKFPRLSRLARSIFSIPATSAGVEREFSAAGLVIQERRTNLNPEQLDNILLLFPPDE
ncbi:unnamed protein product [Rotaria sp. Silwood1]|nr:unnamed protein product [Rotaria sp. Silwood1]